jgi:hypothetical protein
MEVLLELWPAGSSNSGVHAERMEIVYFPCDVAMLAKNRGIATEFRVKGMPGANI